MDIIKLTLNSPFRIGFKMVRSLDVDINLHVDRSSALKMTKIEN